MRTKDHNRKIGIAQKRAWDDGRRKRIVIGTERLKNGKVQIKVLSENGWPFWKNKKLEEILTKKELSDLPSWKKNILRKRGVDIPLKSAGVKKGYKQAASHIEKRRQSQRKYLFDLLTLDRDAKERVRKSIEYRRWRLAVFVRDNWTCQKCKSRNGNGAEVYLEAHHKKPYTKYPKLRFDVNNGLTLCKSCHKDENKKQMKGNKNGLGMAPVGD